MIDYIYNVRKKLLADSELFQQGATPCDHPQCERPGICRAPKTRQLNAYYNFCQEHARAYNQRWDYYSGMDEDAIEADRYNDYRWNRPTWAFGDKPINFRQMEDAIRQNPFSSFQEEQENPQNAASPYVRDVQKALKVLGIKAKPKSFKAVQLHYKKLAKKYHPDANQGDVKKEERLKEINQAYTLLRGFQGMFVGS